VKTRNKSRSQVRGFIVAIDGPSGAGKSTVSRQLAESLQGRLLDTGAMYRSVAYFAIKQDAKTGSEFAALAKGIVFSMDEREELMLFNSENLGAKLRTEEVSLMASRISQFGAVRKVLTKQQRALANLWAKKIPVVVEGRDIGTVVFPDVRFKFFVTADPMVRAQRRFEELHRRGVKGITLKLILKQNQERDRQDSNRKVAPLKVSKDAVVVDTSTMKISQVVQFMKNHIQARHFPEE
jgi:CMP/dCMP kinase